MDALALLRQSVAAYQVAVARGDATDLMSARVKEARAQLLLESGGDDSAIPRDPGILMLAAARRLVVSGFASLPPPVHTSLPPPVDASVRAPTQVVDTIPEHFGPRVSSAVPTVNIPELVARLLANRSAACASSDAPDNIVGTMVPISPPTPTMEHLCILHDVPVKECRHLHAQRLVLTAELSPPCAESLPSKMSSPPTQSPLWSWHELDDSIPHTQPALTTLHANVTETARVSQLTVPPPPVNISRDGHASVDPDAGIDDASSGIKGASIERSCIEPSSPRRRDSLHWSPLSTLASEPCKTGVTPVGSAHAVVLISRELSESLPEAMITKREMLSGVPLAAPTNSRVPPTSVLLSSLGLPLTVVAPHHVVKRRDENTSACPHVISRIPRAAPRPHFFAVGDQRHVQGVGDGGVTVRSNKLVSVAPPQLPPPAIPDARARAAKQKELRVCIHIAETH